MPPAKLRRASPRSNQHPRQSLPPPPQFPSQFKRHHSPHTMPKKPKRTIQVSRNRRSQSLNQRPHPFKRSLSNPSFPTRQSDSNNLRVFLRVSASPRQRSPRDRPAPSMRKPKQPLSLLNSGKPSRRR